MGLRDWELLLAQARRCRLGARLAQHARLHGWWDGIPAAAQGHLVDAEQHARRGLSQSRWEIDRLAHALAELRGPIVLLKGAAYVAAGLPPSQARLFGDIDLMVPHAELPAAEAALLGGGWVPKALDPYDERYYRRWMHELPPLKHVWRHTWVDLHHTITPPTSVFAVDGQRLLDAAVPLAPGSRLSVLSPVDMVLHSMVHLMQEGDFTTGLRDLLDIDDLLRHFGAQDTFWPRLLARAGELALGTPMWHATCQIERLLGPRVPPAHRDALDALAQGTLSRKLMPVLLQHALRPPHPSCDDRGSGLARWLLYVRSHALRMPWHQILPHLLRKAWARAGARLAGGPG